MRLPVPDREFLERSGISYRVFDDSTGMLSVELTDFALPEGLNATHANILFRLSMSYPDTPPDMWWVIPHLAPATGGLIPATELIETYDGRSWQRWSRHLDPTSWRSGTDGLESYVRLLRTELATAAAGNVAA
ncbi:E2/UBC family protein [Curtobacterium flaccumfaciens pv. flaccumfaciens]|uniref:E2/UBC family protein n=1 Tax=Curtobacterium flaccumfaciens TaxID=2035 RepID=UPI003AB7C8C6